jgi:hypothetical protein
MSGVPHIEASRDFGVTVTRPRTGNRRLLRHFPVDIARPLARPPLTRVSR